MVNGRQPRCVGHVLQHSEPAAFCDGFQSGKFELTSNLSVLFFKIKRVDLSDSGLYFCGYFLSGDPVIVSATYLDVLGKIVPLD